MNPSIIRKILYPAHELLMRRPTFEYLGDLEKTQWYCRQDIHELQLQKLKGLLNSARQHSSWHAERIENANINPKGDSDFSFDDFRKLPLMTKADASTYREQIVWHSVPGGAQLYNTGGSSGQPLIFYYGRGRQAADAASRMRARRWWNIDVGEPEVFLWGAPTELNKTDLIKTFRDRLFNQLLLNAFDMNEVTMSHYLKRIHEFNPSCIYGYASSLSLLATFARAKNLVPRLGNLKVICTTGEPLLQEQRELIESTFNIPVSNEYGCRDGGLIALESPNKQLLVNSEMILLEILDSNGQAVKAGEIGEAVITHLHSHAQPFIRYRTGDMVKASDQSCLSGRGLEVIDGVTGRSTDFVVRPDGSIMHALSVIYVLRAIEGVSEFKIIQHTTTHLQVIVVPSPVWKDSAKDTITQRLRDRMNRSIEVDIELVDKIPPESSGKYRYVVSKVSLPDHLEFRS